LIAATEKTLPLRTEGRIVLARVGIGVIVRQGTTPPDISTAEAVRKMLLNARAIAWADPSTRSVATLIARLRNSVSPVRCDQN
jgi:molybdate transport system substrate-binding protein